MKFLFVAFAAVFTFCSTLFANEVIHFDSVFDLYEPQFRPIRNWDCLRSYYNSMLFQKHASSAKVYFNGLELTATDALRIVHQREPVNIAMGQKGYDKAKLKELFGHTVSAYNDPTAKKEDGSRFCDAPNTITVYSETLLWKDPGHKSPVVEIACLSLAAPALDTKSQPHYDYYVQEGVLHKKRYKKEMQTLVKMILSALLDNKMSAFSSTGIRRLVVPLFGQGAFLATLSQSQKLVAKTIFFEVIRDAFVAQKNVLQSVQVVISTYGGSENDAVCQYIIDPLTTNGIDANLINGDILKTAQEHDLIINAWDPHSAPGNGNDGDSSFDGAMGKGSGITLTQLPWLNPYLYEAERYISVTDFGAF